MVVKIFCLAIVITLSLVACGPKNTVNPRLSSEMPNKMIWAWERPEDLRFLDPKDFGVAFLAQTIFLDSTGVSPKPRRQPLELAPGTYLIAVTRIETNKENTKRPSFDAEMVNKVAAMIKNTLDLPDVKGIQIDFDAVVSERAFYRSLMNKLSKDIGTKDEGQKTKDGSGTHPSLTMTSLASWCTGDAWFNDFPVDEAVPMAFQMGADSDKIKNYLRNGTDWQEPLCRGSYGTNIEEGRPEGLKPGRRMYYFKNSAWKPSDVGGLSLPLP